MSQRIFLKIYKNGSILKIQQVDSEPVAIGKSSDVEVCLDKDESILPWHALIEKKEGEYTISDLGGALGTLVNGKKIVESSLSHGDQIDIGPYKLEFFIGTPYAVKSQKQKTSVEESPPPAAPSPEAPAPKAKRKKTSAAAAKKKTKKPAKKSKEKSEALKPPAQEKKSKEKEDVKKEAVKEEVKEEIAEGVKEEAAAPSVSEGKLSQEAERPQPGSSPSFESQPIYAGSWKKFLPKKPSKKTYAPPSSIKNLDQVVTPGNGNTVEVVAAWGERIVSVYHSTKDEVVTIGASKKASIQVPNLFQKEPYPLIRAGQIAQVRLAPGMKGRIITRKRTVDFDFAFKKGVISQDASGMRMLSLGQNEVVCVYFHSVLKVYIRYTSSTAKADKGVLFDFNESELIGIGIAVCLMMIFFFYIGVYYPRKLMEQESVDQKKVRFATIEFKPKVLKPPPMKLKQVKKKIKRKTNLPVARKLKKKPKKKTPSIKKRGKRGTIGGVKKKPKSKSRVKQVTSARSGGSGRKARKQGSRAKSPKVDPTKVGLLGVFGKGGVKKTLDKAFSGAGELSGLADEASGFSGNKEVYSGEGIGTQFKSAGAGGKQNNLIGISGISTKGRGGGTQGFGRGGGLGTRGRVSLSFGVSDIDVDGSVDKNAIKRVILRHKKQLERCHSMVLQTDPSIRGRIRFEWVLEEARVIRVRVKKNQSGSSKLANCVMSRLRTWRFPGAVPSGGSAQVSFSFVFTGN